MTRDEFRPLLQQHIDANLLNVCLNDAATPYVFDTDEGAWNAFRDEFVHRIGVARDDIRVIGSGRFGFSMKPGNNLRSFADTSDVDVVVVSSDFFDRAWLALLEAAYPRDITSHLLGGWLQKGRNELYTGWLTPMAIKLDIRIFGVKAKPILTLKGQWFEALKRASQHPVKGFETLNGRVYRTWRHAELYHLNSLEALRASLNP